MCIHEKESSPEFKALAAKFAALGMVAIALSERDPARPYSVRSIADYSVFVNRNVDCVARAYNDLKRWHPQAQISEQCCDRLHSAGLEWHHVEQELVHNPRDESKYPSFEFDELDFDQMVVAFAAYGYVGHLVPRDASAIEAVLKEYLPKWEPEKNFNVHNIAAVLDKLRPRTATDKPEAYAGASDEIVNLLKRADKEPDLFARLNILAQVYDELSKLTPSLMAPIGGEELTADDQFSDSQKMFISETINVAFANFEDRLTKIDKRIKKIKKALAG